MTDAPHNQNTPMTGQLLRRTLFDTRSLISAQAA
jgi:hypothetical protein